MLHQEDIKKDIFSIKDAPFPDIGVDLVDLRSPCGTITDPVEISVLALAKATAAPRDNQSLLYSLLLICFEKDENLTNKKAIRSKSCGQLGFFLKFGVDDFEMEVPVCFLYFMYRIRGSLKEFLKRSNEQKQLYDITYILPSKSHEILDSDLEKAFSATDNSQERIKKESWFLPPKEDQDGLTVSIRPLENVELKSSTSISPIFDLSKVLEKQRDPKPLLIAPPQSKSKSEGDAKEIYKTSLEEVSTSSLSLKKVKVKPHLDLLLDEGLEILKRAIDNNFRRTEFIESETEAGLPPALKSLFGRGLTNLEFCLLFHVCTNITKLMDAHQLIIENQRKSEETFMSPAECFSVHFSSKSVTHFLFNQGKVYYNNLKGTDKLAFFETAVYLYSFYVILKTPEDKQYGLFSSVFHLENKNAIKLLMKPGNKIYPKEKLNHVLFEQSGIPHIYNVDFLEAMIN